MFKNQQENLETAKSYLAIAETIADPILQTVLLFLASSALSDASKAFMHEHVDIEAECNHSDILYNNRLILAAHHSRPSSIKKVYAF